MADNKKEQTVKGLDGSEPITAPPGVEAPDQPSEGSLSSADRVAGPETGGPDDSPVRTSSPNKPVIQRLAVGAGQHRPTSVTSDDHDQETGRFVQSEVPEQAKAKK
ncbi:MAG: hypothetical protein M3355_12055 [Actinomycetota bacterium]|nr:hypothetical protein [Actinomycetota bacterium]